MKCKKVHKWIALCRDGELDTITQARLMEHLATCESCSRMYKDYQGNDRIASKIRSYHPVCKDGDGLTNRIMDTVAEMKGNREEKRIISLLNRSLDLALLPAVRRTAIACILIITIIFLYLQVYIYSNTAQLEKQLSDAGNSDLKDKVSADIQDCMKKSEQYLLKVKTGKIQIEGKLRIDLRENPEIFMQYACYICSHPYRYPDNSIIEDIVIIPDL
jgi:predicted anti-sigma-YlaC factor YlaD